MSIEATLAALCRRVEAMAPGSASGVTICDEAHTHIEQAVFPTLAPSFAAAIRNVPTEPASFGSCVQAISTGQVITCADIANDIRFDPQWKKVCLEHGLKSLQSRPIFLKGRPVGTFVLGYREPRSESDWNVALMKFGADACEAALANGRQPVAQPGA